MTDKKMTFEDKLKALADRYLAAGKKSVEQIFILAEVIVEAHAEFGETPLTTFYDHIDVEKDGATSKKLLKIGKEKTRFALFFHLLPNNWTTIYALATMEKDKFQRLIDDKILRPEATLKELKAHVTSKKKKSRKRPAA